MWKFGIALSLFSLAGCGGVGSAPPVEPFAAHRGPLFPEGTTGQVYARSTASGFVAWGVADDGSVLFRMSGSADELGTFSKTAERETGYVVGKPPCQPPPNGNVDPVPCPGGPGPTGGGGGTHTMQ